MTEVDAMIDFFIFIAVDGGGFYVLSKLVAHKLDFFRFMLGLTSWLAWSSLCSINFLEFFNTVGKNNDVIGEP